MKVGGRDFNEDHESVSRSMRGENAEPIRKYLVEVNGTPYPPKQVLATVTGWKRSTFTTMEAQRVLNKIGFRCREAGTLADGRAAWLPWEDKPSSPLDIVPGTRQAQAVEERIDALEAVLAAAHERLAGLAARVQILEGQR